ncbi:Putative tagatose-6-phosphate ketose/aldose isomerase [Providencia rustigianii]|uniref:Tagatose-6-phosphate ketose/aldose isomerase n=1 Tax=Providencia rustigianii TaxID=158850 RepID=A0A379G0T0_9GAMM|nr:MULTISPECIES: SIS domain-containing protein [Providencia]MTC58013.1 SIS domain-containing protein [Providencia rustigianii]SPY76568.1 Putative tagatose-6-phosphate ketose/aldose isomerase [Providencia rustigianii]SUC34526.1 Putative tagatose-6-phosphate ketose/aldose isomerase [Providencia rustigianii]VEB63869.1 Putative tagatose-6-phosphate ketose/aldose isomerase [Providencia rustigianii]
MEYLSYQTAELEQLNAFWTAKEIEQQPECWEKVSAAVKARRTEIDGFLAHVLAAPESRIIMTGAGTSAFAGRALAPILTGHLKRRVDAIATTDLVSDPKEYLAEDVPTLLISFARSGNSPESVAALDVAEKCLSKIYHLVLTCNSDGQLYRYCQNNVHALALLMPEESNDRSLAMTSSFSSMMMAALSIFLPDTFYCNEVKPFFKDYHQTYQQFNRTIRHDYAGKFKRVIYLGSGGLQGLAQEAALKMLELTAGKVVANYDTPLGFRHGPKSIVNKETLVVLFLSNDQYIRQYETDLLREVIHDNASAMVIGVTASPSNSFSKENFIYIPKMEQCSDAALLFPYLMLAQAFAFHSSIALGNTPDNPSPTGEINRVVQGVTIYPFSYQKDSVNAS